MKKLLLILTGGTITMKKNIEDVLDINELEDISYEMKYILNSLKNDIHIDVEPLYNIDSTDVTIDHWKKIAECIYSHYEIYDGFVVSHGTDTMAYTASAISFMLQNIGKPVVFTGAQLPLSNVYTDGSNNLINSFLLAANYDIGEVCILFGSRIMRATRARKISAFDLLAFDSLNHNPLGTIGLNFKLCEYVKGRRKYTKLKFSENFDDNIAFVTLYPGLQRDVFRNMIKDTNGVILQGYGAGNISSRFYDDIYEFSKKELPIIICTQCVIGKIELELYKVGKQLADLGVVSASDMTPEAATVKLMWALGQTKDLKKITDFFKRDLVGELS
ncbi:MAG: asparaginase [Candidatus Muiribacteriota bacterium]